MCARLAFICAQLRGRKREPGLPAGPELAAPRGLRGPQPRPRRILTVRLFHHELSELTGAFLSPGWGWRQPEAASGLRTGRSRTGSGDALGPTQTPAGTGWKQVPSQKQTRPHAGRTGPSVASRADNTLLEG